MRQARATLPSNGCPCWMLGVRESGKRREGRVEGEGEKGRTREGRGEREREGRKEREKGREGREVDLGE